jgi:hypothetical protein
MPRPDPADIIPNALRCGFRANISAVHPPCCPGRDDARELEMLQAALSRAVAAKQSQAKRRDAAILKVWCSVGASQADKATLHAQLQL